MQRESFLKATESIGLRLNAEQLARFEAFEEALYQANAVMNLTRVPKEECWLRHFVDSLLFQDLIPQNAELLDIGTGPGFPSWPLACARPDLKVTALDSSGKMLGFLRKHTLPNLEVVQARAEDWGIREQFDVVTGRAVAPLPAQMELSAPPARIGGILIPMRTPTEDVEARSFPAGKLGLAYQGAIARELPGTDIVRLYVIYEKVEKTPKSYPRNWSEIKRQPLTA